MAPPPLFTRSPSVLPDTEGLFCACGRLCGVGAGVCAQSHSRYSPLLAATSRYSLLLQGYSAFTPSHFSGKEFPQVRVLRLGGGRGSRRIEDHR